MPTALLLKYSNVIFNVIPSAHQCYIHSDVLSFAIRHPFGLNSGIGHDYNVPVSDLTANSKTFDFKLHNAIRDSLYPAAKGSGTTPRSTALTVANRDTFG